MLKKLAFASALLATFTGTYAQSSQNFGITGQVTPGACTVTLNGGGVANVGDVSQTTAKSYPINTSATTNLVVYRFPNRGVPINIACAAATKVAVAFVDNKPSQRLAFNNEDPSRYGLSDSVAGTAAIGFYSVRFENTTIDGAFIGEYFNAANGSTTFSKTQPAGLAVAPNYAMPGRTIAFAKTVGATVPDAFTSLAGLLTFDTSASKSYIDSATTVITPTGSGTLTLVYL